ncbi:hypothetical protein QFZ26_000105 [Agromyces ramosus]|uniref:Uncharacterized protein n=1 Tax=Agromyces ramosus TaxID=33879 RepID=A0ABU0R385_9MICO|nr:hypothetical protein [Agromyces ramosus]
MPKPRAMKSDATTMKMPNTMKMSPSPVKNVVESTTRPTIAIGIVRMRKPNSRGTVFHSDQ